MLNAGVGLVFLVLSVLLLWWSARSWRQWRITRRKPILDDVPPEDMEYVVPPLHMPDKPPRSKRWPDLSAISSREEGEAYARLANARCGTVTMVGEFLVTFSGALLGSVALDAIIEGPDASVEKRIGFLLALILAVVGIFLVNVWSRWWSSVSDKYRATAAKRDPVRKTRKSHRISLQSGSRVRKKSPARQQRSP